MASPLITQMAETAIEATDAGRPMEDAILDALRHLRDADIDRPEYNAGTWSRRNLEAMIDDLEE